MLIDSDAGTGRSTVRGIAPQTLSGGNTRLDRTGFSKSEHWIDANIDRFPSVVQRTLVRRPGPSEECRSNCEDDAQYRHSSDPRHRQRAGETKTVPIGYRR